MTWRRAAKSLFMSVGYNVVVWSLVFVLAFPLIWMCLSAIKPETEIRAFPPTFFPQEPTAYHFVRLFTETSFLRYFLNSLTVAGATTILVIAIGTLGAYSLARFRFAGRQFIGNMTLFTYLLPSVVLLIPLYVIIVGAGLANSLIGLTLTYTTFALPFAIWLLRAFIASQPVDMEEAARIDGASRMGAFFDVVIPQALPGIISTALFTFILSWNEYLFAQVFISSDENKTLPPGVIGLLANAMTIEWPLLMAASVVMAVPVVVIFSFLQQHLTRGFGAGAVKG